MEKKEILTYLGSISLEGSFLTASREETEHKAFAEGSSDCSEVDQLARRSQDTSFPTSVLGHPGQK